MKMNVSEDEAEDLMDQMEARNVGYLFENAEKMDIQAERRNTEEARKRAEEAEQRAGDAEQKAEAAERRAEDAEQKAEAAERRAEDAVHKVSDAKKELEDTVRGIISNLVGLCKKDNLSKRETEDRLRNLYKIKETDLTNYFEEIWENYI